MNTSVADTKYTSLLILGAVLLLTLGVGMLPASWFGIKQTSFARAPLDFSSDTVDDLAVDTNSDGTVDWNEIIKQTTGDDQLALAIASTTPDPQAIAELNDPNNLTANLAKNFYLASAYMDKSGVSDTATKDIITQNLYKEAVDKLTYTTYTIQSLSVQKTESSATLKTYGNALGKLVLKAAGANFIANDLKDYKAYIDTKDISAYSRLETKRDTADFIASELAAMPVPASAVALHLVLLNKVAAYHDTLTNMLVVASDPVRASIAYARYRGDVSDMLRTAQDFSIYFKSKHITFSQKEAGYVFR